MVKRGASYEAADDTSMRLEFFPIPGVPEVPPGAAVGKLLLEAAGRAGIELRDDDVVAVAQKVVSKAEGRIVRLSDVQPSPKAIAMASQLRKDARLVEVILRESRRIVRCRGDVLVC